MDPILTRHISFIHRMQLTSELAVFTVRLLRGIVLSAVIMGLWAGVKPGAQDEQFIVGIVSLLFFYSLLIYF